MSLDWSAQQREWLQEMGFDVLARREAAPAMPDSAASPVAATALAGAAARGVAALERVARGVDLAPLLAAGVPFDVAARRAFWRQLRPLRKAARAS